MLVPAQQHSAKYVLQTESHNIMVLYNRMTSSFVSYLESVYLFWCLLIEQVQEDHYDLEGKLWCREKYWQAQLFTLSHGMNSTWEYQ